MSRVKSESAVKKIYNTTISSSEKSIYINIKVFVEFETKSSAIFIHMV